MADRYYGAAIGAQLPVDVTEAAATTGAVVELRISDAAYANKLGVQLALKAIQAYLDTKETSPIA